MLSFWLSCLVLFG